MTAKAHALRLMIESLSDPTKGQIDQWSRRLNLPRAEVKAAIAQISKLNAPITGGDMMAKLEKIAHAAADVIPGKLEHATAQQSAVVLGIALEKLALLRNQPTQIIEHRSRGQFTDLLDAALLEAKRRGTVIDAAFEEVAEDAPTQPLIQTAPAPDDGATKRPIELEEQH